jgi:hypothetical protein
LGIIPQLDALQKSLAPWAPDEACAPTVLRTEKAIPTVVYHKVQIGCCAVDIVAMLPEQIMAYRQYLRRHFLFSDHFVEHERDGYVMLNLSRGVGGNMADTPRTTEGERP